MIDIEYRLGTIDDIQKIIELNKRRHLFDIYWGYEGLEIQRHVVNTFYSTYKEIFLNEDFPLILAMNKNNQLLGFVFLVLNEEEAFVKNTHGRIFDFYVINDSNNEILNSLLNKSMELSKKRGCLNLKLEVLYKNQKLENYLKKSNYYIEMNRILKPVTHREFTSHRQKRFSFRPATENDRTFMLLVVSHNSQFLIPPNRKDEAPEIRDSYFNFYTSLDLSNQKQMKAFIAEDVETGRKAGFIVLDLEPEEILSKKKPGYMEDISVHKDFWGKSVAQRLVKDGENYLNSLGYEYYLADCLETNPRPLMTALRTLKFKLFKRRWVRAL